MKNTPMKPTAINAVTGYAQRLGLLRAPPRGPAAPAGVQKPPPHVPPAAEISAATLDAIGRRNELIRGRFVDIVNKSTELLALRAAFAEASDDVGEILKESESAVSALAERAIMLTRAHEAQADLKARYRAMHEERDAKHGEIEVLRGEVARFEELARAREARIHALEADGLAERGHLAGARAELEKERAGGLALREQLRAATAQTDATDRLVSKLQGDVAAGQASLSVAEFHRSATQASLMEAQADCRALRELVADREQRADATERRLLESEAESRERGRRVNEAEAAVDALHLDQNMAKLVWQEQLEARAEDLARLRADVDELSARAEAGEGSLAKARADLQARSDDLRKAERRAEDIEAKHGLLDERLAVASRDLGATNAKLGEVEASRTRLANRAQALVRVMKDKKVELESALRRAEQGEAKLSADAAQFDAVAARLRAENEALREEVEKEKLARLVAAGALEAARARPLPPKQELDLHALLRHVDLAEAKDEEQRKETQAPATAGPAEPYEGAAPPATAPPEPKPRPILSLPLDKGRTAKRPPPAPRVSALGR